MPQYYYTNFGCMGFVNGNYKLFSTFAEYMEEWREANLPESEEW